jgi:hypothetical protein
MLVAKAVPNADMSLIRLPRRLQGRKQLAYLKKKTGMHTTYSSVASVVLVAKADPNTDMSLIWLPQRLESHYVYNGRHKKPACRQLTQALSAWCWWPRPFLTPIRR